jgi:hypothetical protein
LGYPLRDRVLKNIKLQAPNLRVSGVPPEADQVSGKKNKNGEHPKVEY